jgi:hypothetical protein
MLRDILAAIARADYEAAAASAKLGVAPRPARGGAPLSPVTFSVVAGFFCDAYHALHGVEPGAVQGFLAGLIRRRRWTLRPDSGVPEKSQTIEGPPARSLAHHVSHKEHGCIVLCCSTIERPARTVFPSNAENISDSTISSCAIIRH